MDMSKIWAIAWKDALLRFSERSELLFFIVLPVFFTMLIGGATGGGADDRVPLLVVNEDGGALASELLATLETSGAVRVEARTLAEAEADFAGDDYPALVIIPPGFSAALLEGQAVSLEVRALPDNLNAVAAEQALQAAAAEAARAVRVAAGSTAEAERLRPFASEADKQVYFEAALAQARAGFHSAPARLTMTRPAAGDEAGFGRDDSAGQASAGQLITWVMIPLLGTSALFAFERNRGTLRRLLTTPTGRATFLSGVITGQLGMALLQMVLLVVFGVVVLRLNWGTDPLALAVMLVTFGLASVALGTMLGTFIKTEGQANGISIMLGMLLALLGGCWYPAEFFPEVARTAALALPTTWAMQGLTDLVLRGQGLAAVLPEAGVLVVFAVVFFGVGVARFRYE
jgi:ABC-2 type transport system permease protein